MAGATHHRSAPNRSTFRAGGAILPPMTDDLRQRLNRPRFPRSAGYDPRWMIENWMGPSALWLLEWLCSDLALAPGARVLDLGCGRAITSIFLAREFDVQVVAADLWIKPTDN